MGHVRDRWVRSDPTSGRKVRNERWGKGMRWQARTTRTDGTAAIKAFTTKDQAELWVARAATEPQLVAPRVLFAAAADEWLTHQLHYRPSTREATGRWRLWLRLLRGRFLGPV